MSGELSSTPSPHPRGLERRSNRRRNPWSRLPAFKRGPNIDDMPWPFRANVRGSAWRTYVGAPIVTVLVVWARLTLDSSWGHLHNRHLVFFPTVMLCAWVGGLRAGVLSAVISTVALSYFWAGPALGFAGFRPEVVLFFLTSVGIC